MIVRKKSIQNLSCMKDHKKLELEIAKLTKENKELRVEILKLESRLIFSQSSKKKYKSKYKDAKQKI